ncbi:hypothetical protein HK100_000971 [Physocladia obscura]|uniref:Uncharacterized protein n=1 Tax=Physocladia obscura TaxID=109957 RepID=A0AAD5SYJ0_9FUNG|nr:hypothetical protein HK100_000971 [Physocladia obscura]
MSLLDLDTAEDESGGSEIRIFNEPASDDPAGRFDNVKVEAAGADVVFCAVSAAAESASSGIVEGMSAIVTAASVVVVVAVVVKVASDVLRGSARWCVFEAELLIGLKSAETITTVSGALELSMFGSVDVVVVLGI